MAESNIFVREELTEDDDYLTRGDDEDFANFLSSPGDPEPYRFEPEYSSEELRELDAAWARMEAEESQHPEEEIRVNMNWWCGMPTNAIRICNHLYFVHAISGLDTYVVYLVAILGDTIDKIRF